MRNFLIILLPFLIITGCTKNPNITFCEGVSPDGKGIDCGIKFETGDLTAILKSDKAFGVNKIDVVVSELNDNKAVKLETISVDVPPEEVRINVNLSFYRGGKFKITAMNGSEQIGEGDIEIVDTL